MQRLRGILLMVAAFGTFALLDATAKYLSPTYATQQIVFARYLGAFVFGIVVFAPRAGMSICRTRRPGLQMVRSALLLAGTYCNFTAVKYLQLAETSSIMFATPLLVCAFSVPLLGERVGPRRWAAVVVGFAGVLVIVRPGLEGFHWAALFSIAAALATALYQIATRRLASVDAPETTLFFTALVGTLVITPIMPFYWTTPDLPGMLLMVVIGLFGGFGHYLLIRAHHLAPAPVLAPFSYSQILWMTMIGLLVFGDLPGVWTIAGGAIVIASGLYLLYRERSLERQ